MKILLITSGQPSLNPRLVKEADALLAAGYDVTVIYQYWNKWATDLDKELISKKKWRATRICGDPVKEKIIYWRSRIILKIARKFTQFFGFKNNLAELSIGRCTLQLVSKAKSIQADLYIAHNLAALPAAVIAAKYNDAKSGFDAEDLHRHEMSDENSDQDVRLKKFIEEKYFPLVNYLTTSSPQIKEKYESFFPNLAFNTILNVFPKNTIKLAPKKNKSRALKLFWFSQNVGLSRGIQDIISALKILQDESIQLHILGFLNQNIKAELNQLIKQLNFNTPPNIIFHQPIAGDELCNFATNFDIGLATEPGFSINNDLALSNKIFTYVQAGLAIIASDTSAQQDLLTKYPNMGIVYEKGNAISVAKNLKTYLDEPELLRQHQNQSIIYAETDLNWEKESLKLLTIINNVLAS